MKSLFCKACLFVVLLGSWIPLARAEAPQVVVQVQLDDAEYWQAFAVNPRLTQVLSQLDDLSDIYWPAAALFALDATDIEQQRQELLRQLQRLEQYWQQKNQTAYVISLQSLRQQVAELTLAYRVPILVDYDRARILAKHNPRLKPGQYRLVLPKRSEHISVLGQVAYEQQRVHLGASTVSAYLTELATSGKRDPSWVYVIQANGQLDKVGVAYWNWQHYEVMPGSQLYLPMAKGMLPADFRSLNQQLAELLVHRVLP